jgi:predicted MFS family arabinose efflux permease
MVVLEQADLTDRPAAPPEAKIAESRRYRWGVLLLLTLAYVVSMIDRQLPFILAQPIKAELHLSDTQIGLLGGILFAGFYAVCGLPLARLADLYSRKFILAGAITFWSLLTGFGGLATNFFQLAISRIGGAVGEAGCTPAAHSLIADYFPLSKRATAIAIYSIGGPIGTMLGLILGGWINDLYNWRIALLVVGLPGVLLAVAIMVFMREPVRGSADERAAGETLPEERPGLMQTLRLLWSRKCFRHMVMGVGLYAFGASAKVAFAPAFLMRSHGLTAGEAGAALGLVVGISGIAGTLAGGVLADILGKADKRWYLWLPGIALFLAAPSLAISFLAPGTGMSLGFLVPSYGLGILFIAPTFAIAQALVDPRARAMASAVLMASMFIIGNSFGPTIVGAVSDYLMPTMGRDSLRWALSLTALTNLWGVYHYFRAAHFVRGDLAQPAK